MRFYKIPMSDDKTLIVKRTATGLGLFATQPIKRGARILKYKGEIISTDEANRRANKYLFELDEKRTIDGSSRDNLARYFNHACRPNAKGYSIKNKIWIYAERNIKAGEQITINYGKAYFDQHIRPKGCKCARCLAE